MSDKTQNVLVMCLVLLGIVFAFTVMHIDHMRKQKCEASGGAVVYGGGYMNREWRCE